MVQKSTCGSSGSHHHAWMKEASGNAKKGLDLCVIGTRIEIAVTVITHLSIWTIQFCSVVVVVMAADAVVEVDVE